MSRLLSPKELAAAIGVSESSLKRWADAGRIHVSRTEGGHRRITLSEAVRFIRETRAPVVRPEVLGLPELGAVEPEDAASEDAVYEHLIAGHAREVRGLVLARYLGGEPVAAIFDGALREAMTRIGERWRHQGDGVFVEHRATDICLAAVAALRAIFESPIGAAVVVGGAPEGDPYVLPSLMAATVLAAEGLRAVNLGADTPASALGHAVRHHHPLVTWISISAPLVPARADELVAALHELARSTTVVVGGRHRGALAAHPEVTVVATMAELAARARGLARH
jgi:excisionase family DNA binding protein